MNPDFYHQPTAGEIPALRPTTGPLLQSPYSVVPPAVTTGPLSPPLAHTSLRPPTDQLLSRGQRAIIKAADDIFTILSLACKCEKCRNGVMIVLSDLLSEALTDQTITTLSMNKLERAVKDHD